MQRPLDLYALFRLKDIKVIGELNRLTSGKSSSVRKHEIESLRGLADALSTAGAGAAELDGYYFSYTIPKIGKEFDVLRLSDSLVLNIELKYVNVGIREIAEQQRRNRYYLNSLGREVFICTYVFDEKKFYTLDAQDKLTECSVNAVMEAVNRSNDFCSDDPDRLFDPEDYIFSPLTDPNRLLEGRYFLTQHQESIEKRLIGLAFDIGARFASVSGGSGTGKTLLLYDLALKTARKMNVCVISHDTSSASVIDNAFSTLTVTDAGKYMTVERDQRNFDAVFLDDAHLMDIHKLEFIIKDACENGRFCVFFTESPTLLNTVSRTKAFWRKLKRLVGAEKHQLTDRICTEPEVAAFINKLINSEAEAKNEKRLSYGNTFVLYAANRAEAKIIADRYAQKGYGVYAPVTAKGEIPPKGKRLILLGRSFAYDGDGFLTAQNTQRADEIMEKLVFTGFKGIDGALGILVVGNTALFKKILGFFK